MGLRVRQGEQSTCIRQEKHSEVLQCILITFHNLFKRLEMANNEMESGDLQDLKYLHRPFVSYSPSDE